MDLPKIAAKVPCKVDLEAGKRYAWCTCGLSENQPFCNGSHKGTDFRPHVFTCEESATKHMCQCKHTKNESGFCDGSHKAL